MTIKLRAERYAKAASTTLPAFIVERLHYLDFNEAMAFYRQAMQHLKGPDWALLGCNDRFFLLTALLNRADAIHPWLYERAREIESEPDGHLDLWARFHYKAVDVNELVPTPTASGWTAHGDLKPGDYVYGPDGKPTKVVARTPVFLDADCYNVTFSDGYEVVVSGDHLWTVRLQDRARVSGSNRRKGWKTETIRTADLRPIVEAAQKERWRRFPVVPQAAPVWKPHQDLPIDPYVLGVWLGDGSSAAAVVTVGHDDAEEMQRQLEMAGVEVGAKDYRSYVRLTLKQFQSGQRRSCFNQALRDLRVFDNKRIPASYMYASAEQRWALLQGLMDTDGSCHARHSQAIFCSANTRLANQVFDLALSLGLRPTMAQRWGKYQGEQRSYWQVQFLADSDRPPFRLPRKAARARGKGRDEGRRIVAIEPVPSRPVSCITVDRQDGLYLIGTHYVVTHNSTFNTFAGAIQEALIDPETRICIFSNNKGTARPFLQQIKDELESNADLKRLYPDVLYENPRSDAPMWSLDNGLVVKRTGNYREATFEAHGVIDALPTGKHFPILLYDDIITEKNVTNPEQIAKATERTELSFPIGIGEKTRRRMSGTRYHFADSYGQLMDRGVAKARLHPATDNGKLDGDPVFMTKEAWEAAKRDMRTTIAAQMLQNPIAGKENMFSTKWLKPYWLRPIVMNVYIMGDPSKGRSATSDRTALAVIGIDTGGNKFLLDGFCHRMQLSERWQKLEMLHRKWSNMPGVQSLKVGYERYGVQADDEYFDEKMRESGRRFDIEELNWTGQVGRQSKENRVERLEPDFRNGNFFVPAKVWNAAIDAKTGVWYVEDGKDEIHYSPIQGQHRLERQARANGELWRIIEPIKRVDEDGNIYDLTRVFFEEYTFFPFSPRDDLIDAMSRIYDMEPRPAVLAEKIVIEEYVDS